MNIKFLIKNQVDLNENDRACSVSAAKLCQQTLFGFYLQFTIRFCQQVLFDFCCQSVRMLIGSVSRTEAECDISCSQSANIF